MARAQKGHKYVSGVLTFCLVLLLLVAAAAAGGSFAYSYVKHAQSLIRQVEENLKNPVSTAIPETARIYFEIPSGSSTSKIADLLEKAELIKNKQFFKILSKVNGFDGLYQPGTHIVSEGMGYEQIMLALCAKPEILRLVFPEGLNSSQVYAVIRKAALTNRDGVKGYVETADFSSYGFLDGLPKRSDRLEGYLFPDTYDYDLHATPRTVIEAMLNNFNRKLTQEHRDRAAELGMSIDDVVTLASIIEREAKNEEDRFLVSGVFHNRLRSGDPSLRMLQSCATVQYVFYQRNGVMLQRISESDTRVLDPYNTYIHEGLPPGPICNPGISSINAALYPEDTDYMFFVARGDGTHEFTKTYEEHMEAVREYGLNLMP